MTGIDASPPVGEGGAARAFSCRWEGPLMNALWVHDFLEGWTDRTAVSVQITVYETTVSVLGPWGLAF